jgi:hypothetical protein
MEAVHGGVSLRLELLMDGLADVSTLLLYVVCWHCTLLGRRPVLLPLLIMSPSLGGMPCRAFMLFHSGV